MNKESLAKVFGPTIVGHSTAEPEAHAIITETPKQKQVRDPEKNTHFLLN